MEINLQMEGGSEQATSSDDGQFIVALRKMMEKEIEAKMIHTFEQVFMPKIEVKVIHTVEQVIMPKIEALLRKIVKEEIQSAEAKFSTGGNRSLENEVTLSKERNLGLQFMDKVSHPVLTGKVLKGEGETPLTVALVDKITGQVIDDVPKSSLKVEILLLEANDDDDDNDWGPENFNNKIIREDEEGKPHFAAGKYINLKDGIGTLCDTKLGHSSKWMKKCKCRLGARMESFGGIKVQEAWTESFTVSDNRSEWPGNKKHHPPSLSDEVWRLDCIGKDGGPCRCLYKKKIRTVGDFLFLHHTNPEALQQATIKHAPAKNRKATIKHAKNRKATIKRIPAKNWKATIKHAKECVINDKGMYLYCPLSEPYTGVVFDVVGQLKGAIQDSHYVPKCNLSKAEEDWARKLLLPTFEYRNNTIPFNTENAFQNQDNIFTFDDEDALLQQFPCRPSHVIASTNFVVLEGSPDGDLIFESNIEHDHFKPDTLSQIVQSNLGPSGHPNNICNSGSANMGQLDDPGSGVHNWSPSHPFSDFNHLLENFVDRNFPSLISPEWNNIPEPIMVDSRSHGHINASSIQFRNAIFAIVCVLRMRRQIKALGGIHVHKRQRT